MVRVLSLELEPISFFMPNTLEQILGSQPNWRQQFADTSNQIIQDAKNVSLADYDRATGTYVPRSQRTNAPAFTQRDLTSAQTQPAQKQQDTTPQPLSYADMFVRMNPYRPQTAEEKEAERKRNRRNAVFAAIGDGISALSNLYFTTKGAPNAYTGGSTLTGKMYERQEQLRKERQALDQQYLNAYMNALRMDRQEAQQERNWKMQLENLAYNRKRQEEADARAAELHPYQVRYNEARAKAQEANAAAAEEYQASRIAAQNALVGQRNASAAASAARANGSGSRSGGGSSSKSYQPYTVGGERFYLPNTFWSNNGQVSTLYGMLPESVRNEAEGKINRRTGLASGKGKNLNNQQKSQVIMDHATPEIKEILRSYSSEYEGAATQSSSNSAPWVSGTNSNNAPWIN